ncbi:type II toxin-antitoxin system Phd/YefM family antitoxin [Enterobacterales bacterium AE_CKDN230030158-1A_HGKHYDSX7]
MPHSMLADVTASITELKKDPMGTVAAGMGHAVAILNRNEPVFYAVPAEEYERMMELLDDLQLGRIAELRKDEPTVEVTLDELRDL